MKLSSRIVKRPGLEAFNWRLHSSSMQALKQILNLQDRIGLHSCTCLHESAEILRETCRPSYPILLAVGGVSHTEHTSNQFASLDFSEVCANIMPADSDKSNLLPLDVPLKTIAIHPAGYGKRLSKRNINIP
eukprot:1149530-Pelagomonas_calceolata.AAC.2